MHVRYKATYWDMWVAIAMQFTLICLSDLTILFDNLASYSYSYLLSSLANLFSQTLIYNYVASYLHTVIE